MLEAIEKEDELYGAVINRYCLITAEIKGLQEDREYYSNMLREMREDLHNQKEQLQNPGDYIQLLADIGRSMAAITKSIGAIDGIILKKRKMLLDIEKESVMTISAALRTVPVSYTHLIEEYKQLRKDEKKVWHGKLAGKLLADVLEADFMEAM